MTQAPVVPGDVPCTRCGYNLRGSPEASACPECGAPVADSLRGDRLQFASPEYLATLVRGARLVWWGVAFMLLGIIGGVFLGALLAGSSPIVSALLALGQPFYLATTVLGLVGWWLVSTPDPAAELDRARASRARVVLRGALIVSAAGTLAGIVADAFVLPGRPGGGPTPATMLGVLLAIAQTVGRLGWLVHMIAATFYVQYLASRVPDRTLAASARAVLWVAAATLAIVVVTAASIFVFTPFAIAACVLPIAFLVVIVVYIRMIDRLKATLTGVAAAR